ncbi:MAG: regulatory protein RecX [Firmicutes bacterium]|nr:regulatory protein RecX [Bacillota bacterium]
MSEEGLAGEKAGENADRNEQQAQEVALRYLAQASRSKASLILYLKRKGFSHGVAEKVAERLEAESVIDDTRTARSYAEARLASQPRGKGLLAYELRQRGYAEDVIRAVMRDLYPDGDETLWARRALSARFSWQNERLFEDPALLKKAQRFLHARGFSTSTILAVLKEEPSTHYLD